jgi:hypothetical protein
MVNSLCYWVQGNCTGPPPSTLVKAVSKRLSKTALLRNFEPRLSTEGQCLISLTDRIQKPDDIGNLWLHNLFLASSLTEPSTDTNTVQMVLENAYITNCNLASQGAVILKNAFLEGAQPMATRQEYGTVALTSKACCKTTIV